MNKTIKSSHIVSWPIYLALAGLALGLIILSFMYLQTKQQNTNLLQKINQSQQNQDSSEDGAGDLVPDQEE